MDNIPDPSGLAKGVCVNPAMAVGFYSCVARFIPPGELFALWALNPENKKQSVSRFVSTVVEFSAFVKEHAHWHVYYCASTRAHEHGLRPSQRGGEEDCASLLMLNLDIDWADPIAHKAEAQTLPRDRAAAYVVLDGLKVKPSVVVESGHGLQLLFILEEPFSLNDDAARQYAKEAGRRLHADCLRAAHGAHVDATHNLDRLLRLPGTVNWKDASQPVLATWKECGHAL